jgi:ribosomal protein L12E/L44/L45/RPP1/RPP2
VLEGAQADITVDSLTAVIKAAGLTVNINLTSAVAKALKGKKASEYFGSAGGAAPAASEAAPAKAAKTAEKPK